MGLHALDMINRYKENRYWLGVRRQRRAALRKMYADSVKSHQETTGTPGITFEELQEIKRRIRILVDREKRKGIIVLILAVILALLLIVFVFWLLFLK